MKKRAIFTILLITLCAIFLCSCKNEPDRIEKELPQEYKDYISLSNVTIKVESPSNTFFIKYVDDAHIYKTDNGSTTPATASDLSFITNLANIKVYDSFSYVAVEPEDDKKKEKEEEKRGIYDYNEKGCFKAYDVTATYVDGSSKAFDFVGIAINTDDNLYTIEFIDSNDNITRVYFYDYGTTVYDIPTDTPDAWINYFKLDNVTISMVSTGNPTRLTGTYNYAIVSPSEVYIKRNDHVTNTNGFHDENYSLQDPETLDIIMLFKDMAYMYSSVFESPTIEDGTYSANIDANNKYEITVADGKITKIVRVYKINANYLTYTYTFSNYGTTEDPTVTV